MTTNPFSEDAPVYVISVAAQLSGLHPQTLRTYDRMGLVRPGRAAGRGRRYSMRDIEMLREIQRLSQGEGVNLAGIKRILELQREVVRLREEITRLRGVVEELSGELESTRAVAARLAQLRHATGQSGGTSTDLVPIRQAGAVTWPQRAASSPPSPGTTPPSPHGAPGQASAGGAPGQTVSSSPGDTPPSPPTGEGRTT